MGLHLFAEIHLKPIFLTCKRATIVGLSTLTIASGLASYAKSPSKNAVPKPVTENLYHQFDEAKAALGQLLFYDPLLSGNRNISCATCHHPDLASADGLALGVGEGGTGLGASRTVGEGSNIIRRRVPRNAPALFNLGAKEFTALFHDGRLAIDPADPSGFHTPADEDTPHGLSGILAAQALFPLTSEVEMAGQGKENEIGQALEDIYGNPWLSVWEKVELRLQSNHDYTLRFADAFADIDTPKDITIVHYANAVGDFLNAEWRSSNSPFDRYLAGNKAALTQKQRDGFELFYGKANCSSCHSGPFLTDQSFHAIAMPQIGPGKVARLEAIRHDRGRGGATNRIEDRYKFRTPSLRNVELTAPYGHSGALKTLEAVVRHHLDPVKSFEAFSTKDVTLPEHPKLSREDTFIMQDRRERRRILNANVLMPQTLGDDEVAALVSFLKSLTDSRAAKGRLGKPDQVPSGLPLD
ncbi:MAG: cytochrome c peroxidase [Hyphomicrobiales bacterium]